MYNQTNNVNIKPKSYLPEFHVSQNDVGRTLTAHLVSDDGDVTIQAGATVTMAGTKPSGLGYTVAGTVDGSDVSFDTDAVMTDEPGRIVSEIRIVQGDTLIGTTNVVLSVEPNPHPDDTTDGRREPLVNEITALLTQITEQADRVEEYSGKVLNMTVTAHESDEVTVTKTDGEVVNLDFGLPRGPQGPQGIPGEDGQDGVTPDFTIGTVETLVPGEQATATITGTEEDPVLNLGIPQGAKGDKGDPGEVSLETLAKVMVSDTASGTIASFADGSDVLPAKSVLVTLNPKQSGSGTPSPSNVRPISGWDEVETVVSGVNVWDEKMRNGYYDANGIFHSYSSNLATKNLIKVKPNITYHLHCGYASAGFGRICFYDIDGNCISTLNISGSIDYNATMPSNAHYFAFDLQSGYGTTYRNDICINYPSTDTDYHAYNHNSAVYHVSWQTEAGTVYGGTLDVVSGVLTVDRAMVDLGSLNWSYSSTAQKFATTMAAKKVRYSADVGSKNVWCSALETVGAISSVGVTVPDCVIFELAQISGSNVVCATNSAYTDATAFKTAMSGQTMVYFLATPTTIQCDPQTVQTLIGDNNVWGGDGVVVDYYADTKLYIEKMLGA